MLNAEGMTGDLRDLTFVASEIGKQLNTIFIEELATRRSIKSAASLITNSLARAGSPPINAKVGPIVGETFMAKPSDKEIAARAYKLWEQKGQPEGRDEEFWRLAEQELLNEDKSSPLRTPDTL